jgi:hypothetical protein
MLFKKLIALAFILPAYSCINYPEPVSVSISHPATIINRILDISLPAGFNYLRGIDTAYINWLLDLKLKKENTVYLYNRKKKVNQSVHFAVGNKDLLQCADAVMKQRADFLFARKRFSEINFVSTSGDSLFYTEWHSGIRWEEKDGRLIKKKEFFTYAKPSEHLFILYGFCLHLLRHLFPVPATYPCGKNKFHCTRRCIYPGRISGTCDYCDGCSCK